MSRSAGSRATVYRTRNLFQASAMLLYRPEGKSVRVKTDVKSGLVVIAIIAILMGPLLPAIQ